MAEKIVFIKGDYIRRLRDMRRFGDTKAGPLDDCFGAQKVISENDEIVEFKPAFKDGGSHRVPITETWIPS